MRHSREARSRVLRAGLLALAGIAVGGCYSTTGDDGPEPPAADEPSNEDSSSSVPPIGGGPAPLDPADTPPVVPPEPPRVEPPPTEPIREQRAVSVEAEPGFVLINNGRIVGDLDGDGLDDLVLFAIVDDLPNLLTPPATTVYVFYGRADLPDALEAGAADAVLRGAGLVATRAQAPGAEGDLNGDGLADVVIGGPNEVYFLFGSEQRLSDEHAISDVAVRWAFEPLMMRPAFEAVRVAPAGDVQGDGLFDVALTVTTGEHITQLDSGLGFSPIDSTFLIAGRKEPWPSGPFDAAWAKTAFVVDGAEAGGCSMFGAADLNGDGFSDLVLQADADRRLVLGGDDAPTGEVQALEAGDALALPVSWVRALPDLDGDGTEEMVWSDFNGRGGLNLTYGASDLDPAELALPDVVISAGGMVQPAVTVTDFDGDGTMELMMLAGGAADPQFGLYLLPVDGLRDVDAIGLDDARLVLSLRGSDPTTTAPMALGLDAGGDLNGDGLVDLVITILVPDPDPQASIQLTLLLSGR